MDLARTTAQLADLPGAGSRIFQANGKCRTWHGSATGSVAYSAGWPLARRPLPAPLPGYAFLGPFLGRIFRPSECPILCTGLLCLESMLVRPAVLRQCWRRSERSLQTSFSLRVDARSRRVDTSRFMDVCYRWGTGPHLSLAGRSPFPLLPSLATKLKQ